MTVARVIEINGGQAVQLPAGFHIDSATVSIHASGQAIVLQPVRPDTWPADFFERIAIDDPNFKRPEQGTMPPVPRFDQAAH